MPPEGVDVRRFDLQDDMPDQLKELHRDCFGSPPLEEVAAMSGVVLLYVSGKCAYLAAMVVPPEAEVLYIATAPEDRRQGCAEALFAELGTFARDVYLEVREENTPARALYEHLGFRQIGRRPSYYGPLTDALIYAKHYGEGENR